MRQRGLLGLVGWLGLAAAGCDNSVVVPNDGDTDGDSGDETGNDTGHDVGGDDGVGDTGIDTLPPGDTTGSDPDPDDGAVRPDPVCGDGTKSGTEECDGADFGGATCGSDGGKGSYGCNDDCTIDLCGCEWDGRPSCPMPGCGNGIVEDDEECDGSQWGGWDFEPSCADILGPSAQGQPECRSCMADTSGCAICGDGVVDPGYEACDPARDETIGCSALLGSGYEGTASCADDCGWNIDGCTETCGNGVLDDSEPCDGELFGDQTCESLGHVGGALGCSANCTLLEASCDDCGDGVLDPGEACDGEAFGGETCADFFPLAQGALTCDDSCELVTDACEPDPAWAGLPLFSELMVASASNPDFNPGEWLELYNSSLDADFDLQSCQLQGAAPFESFTFPESLVIAAGGFVTLGQGTEAELGFAPDYSLPAQVTLLNSGDTVRLVCGGTVVDEVEYGAAAPWPTFEAGVSIALGAEFTSASDNDAGAAWCASTGVYALMQQGTPGAPNDCP